MKDAIIVGAIVGGLFIAFLMLHALKWAAYLAFRGAATSFLPFERRILQLLQDRAAARALGVDIGIIRARRKIDFPDH